MNEAAPRQTRAFRMALDIDAPADAVWRALTDAGELARWFPNSARVTPGVGGTMLWSWDGMWDWETRIDAWEPGRLLRLVQEDARPYDIEGRQLPPGEVEPAAIAIEFTLETHQGKTRLRLVHSGFGHGAAWDDEVEGITEGWQAELRSLRHYLERKRGRNRNFQVAWLTTDLSRQAAWARLLGPGGFRLHPAEPAEGHPFEVEVPGKARYSGTTQLYLAGQTMAGTVRELDDGWFRLLTWTAAGKTGVWAGLATWSEDDARPAEFAARTREALERLFAGT
ncbi:MAG TPA: SRPBCC domain-containing protein [Gemmatimonadales bacterium]|nr:SRPBCC domain-containing protein [Gemmatimonadales bacterium]